MISLLLPDLRGGGAERVMLDLAHEFKRSGHDVDLVLMRANGEFLNEALRDFAVTDLGSLRARHVTPALVRYLHRRRPSAIVAAMWPLTAIVPIAARLAGYPGKVIVSEHAILSRQYADLGSIHGLALRVSTFVGYRLSTARVGVSNGVCQDMAALSRLPENRFVVIHNPLRTAEVPDQHALAVANGLWGGAGPRILTVGNLKPVKNHSLLLRAFATVPRSDARLMILGGGAGEAALRALAVDLGIADRVILPGFYHDPTPFYKTANLFVLSSDHEGFGNVIVEALAQGLPVVTTDCPFGPAEILQNGRFGRLVPVGDAAALSRAMDDALTTSVDREALKRRAADFAPEIAARRYLELLGLT